MTDRSAAIIRFAELLHDARATGRPLATVPADLVPLDTDEADVVQFAWADLEGPIGGYKVMQVADRDGFFGVIPAARISTAPAVLPASNVLMKIEIEVAALFGRDLPGRPDGAPYGAEEVAEAIAGAFPVFELLETRLPASPPATAARADAMSNWGLVTGPLVTDWRAAVRPDLAVRLTIGDRVVVDQVGGHPSEAPFHGLTWLANALVRAGRPLRAGHAVTTGAYGGGHAIVAGDHVTGEISGFPKIEFRLG